MLARRLPGIQPPLTFDEALEVTAVHSVAGLLPEGTSVLSDRPFRAPHHTSSEAALVGGGPTPRPGEISLAHHGVLFMDELPEFSRRALEVLRQPIEEGRVRIARAAATVSFPSRFTFIGAMNPCPCGFHGHPARPCRCTPHQVEQYHNRVSGPLRDRIDMTVELAAVPFDTLAGPRVEETSASVRLRVQAARHRQRDRAAVTGSDLNARLTPSAAQTVAALDRSAARCLRQAATTAALSARAIHRLLRVARTIADLEASDSVRAEHVAEAAQYRQPLSRPQ
jgi:magnesium chelatase family protein